MATTTHIKFNNGLTVTDEGAGVIRVDSVGATGPGVPAGGATGQTLKKTTGADYDTSWQPVLPADTVVAAATRIIANLTTAGDTQPAWRVLGSGRMEWGAGGTTAVDVFLERLAAGQLRATSTNLL